MVLMDTFIMHDPVLCSVYIYTSSEMVQPVRSPDHIL